MEVVAIPLQRQGPPKIAVCTLSRAANLTEDLPQGVDADVLLLGCGDTTRILYTSFANMGFPERKLDITACDVDEHVLGRPPIISCSASSLG